MAIQESRGSLMLRPCVIRRHRQRAAQGASANAMLLYLGQRIALFVATLLFASLVVFAVMQILPGDAAQTMLGPTATPEAVAALSHKLGLDLPAPIRYARWIGGALHGDLGLSYAYGSPIAPADRLEPCGQRAAGADGDGARRNHRACRRRLRRGSARPRGRCDRHGLQPGRHRRAELLARDPARAGLRGDAEARSRGRISRLGSTPRGRSAR